MDSAKASSVNPQVIGFDLDLLRRLCLAGTPLVFNVYIVVLVSALFWSWRMGTDDLPTTHTQHLAHLLTCLAAAIVATIYAVVTKKLRLVPTLTLMNSQEQSDT